MINIEDLSNPDYANLDLKNKLKQAYLTAGIPVKYQFKTLEKEWSKNFSPNGELTGLAKIKSQEVFTLINAYIKALDSIVAGHGLKVKLKNQTQMITDLIFDGSKSSGKTLLLSLIAQEAINRGHSVRFVEWSEYCDKFISFESRGLNEEFYNECINCDVLLFDNFYQYDISNNRYFVLQFDRLISTRLNKGKVTICSIDTKNNYNPTLGFIWNKFSRETFIVKLPETSIKNENKPKRPRT
jgi:hypothetical protein